MGCLKKHGFAVLLGPMTEPRATVRRADLEDLPRLRELWLLAGYVVPDLERRFTEFQVVESSPGKIHAAVALQLGSRHGRIHSEVHEDPGSISEHRLLLWERLQTVSKNHGLLRLWVVAPSPWESMGFLKAEGSVLERLPAVLGTPDQPWSTFALREDSREAISLEKELEIFQQMQREETANLLKRTRFIKMLVAVIAMAFAGFVAWLGVMLLRRRRALFQKPGR